jgi:hypothetical protein
MLTTTMADNNRTRSIDHDSIGSFLAVHEERWLVDRLIQWRHHKAESNLIVYGCVHPESGQQG